MKLHLELSQLENQRGTCPFSWNDASGKKAELKRMEEEVKLSFLP